MTGESPVRYVLRSTVRSDVLARTVEGPVGTGELIADADASESAVYTALTDLERRGLVRSVEEGWTGTGGGRLVADALAHHADLSRLLDREYWRTHDVGALPREFRVRLPELADAEILESSDTDPHAIVREVSDRIAAGAPDVDVVSPIYQAEYESVMPDDERARLLIDPSVITDGLGDENGDVPPDPAAAMTFEETTVRVHDVDVAFAVTDDHLTLSLPTLDGQYDFRTEVIATGECALAWGQDLFEHYWTRARPAEEFLSDILG